MVPTDWSAWRCLIGSVVVEKKYLSKFSSKLWCPESQYRRRGKELQRRTGKRKDIWEEMGEEKVKEEAMGIIGMFQVVPRLVVFDLDYTLWPFYWYPLFFIRFWDLFVLQQKPRYYLLKIFGLLLVFFNLIKKC